MSANRNWLFIATLLISCFATYYSSLNYNFTHLDDYVQVVDNTNIRSIELSSIKKIFSSTSVGMYQPVSTLFYALSYQFFQLNPFGYHLLSLIFHLINALLFYQLAKQFFKNEKLNYLLTLIFALHPIQVESIAWVSAFSNLAYSCFSLAGLLFYLKFNKENKATNYIICLAFFILAALSKSAAVIFPLIIILIDFYQNKSIKKNWLNKVPFLLIAIVFGIITLQSRETAGHLSDLSSNFNAFDRVFLIAHSILFYPIKFIFPSGLSAFYPYPEIINNLLPINYYLSLVALSLLGIVVYRFRKHRLIWFGVAFYLICIGLLIQIVPFGNQITTDRYIYLPMIGLLFVLGFLLNKIDLKRYFNLLYLVPVVLAILSINRTSIWEDDEKLWNSVIAEYPNVSQAYNNLGSVALEKNNPVKALQHFNKAIELQANYADAYANRGNIYSQQGKSAKAIQDFNTAISLQSHADAYFNRANEFSKLGDINSAIQDYTSSLKIQERADTYTNRAFNYLKLGKLALAKQDLENSLNINPNFERSYFLLGLLEQRNGNLSKACNLFKKAMSLGSENAKLAIQKSCR